ncbi:MAG: LacI family DNA-binding transcriptional regulator [Desulfobacterales bacterium]
MAKRVTAKDIAESLGVSMMTVSRAINGHPNVNNKTRERVISKAKELGYTPNHVAKSLVLQKTSIIGVVVPEITHSFFPEAIRGIEDALFSSDYQLILTHSAEDDERERKAIETLESKRVDGILISTSESTRRYTEYEKVVQSGIPLVFFDRCVQGIGASCIRINDTRSAKMVTEHLVEHGYKRIAHLRGPEYVSIGKARYEGYVQALESHGIPVDKGLVVTAGFHEDAGYKAMKYLLENEEVDAVVAVNDPAAFGAYKAIREKGLRVPDDIAIAGFSDDIRAELMETPLTTVRQPAYEVGNVAAKKLLAHIERVNEQVEEITIETELVIRRSCGCPS